MVETIQGANPPELTAAVERAVRLAGAGKGAAFAGEGRRLGGSPIVPRSGGRGGGARSWDLMALLEVVLRFVGLYFWTLFSVSVFEGVLVDRHGANSSSLIRIRQLRTRRLM